MLCDVTVPELIYKPGETVPKSGVYRIYHHQHRLMHEATLEKDTRFPQCRACKTKVKFSLIHAAKGSILPFRENEILEDVPALKAKRKAAG